MSLCDSELGRIQLKPRESWHGGIWMLPDIKKETRNNTQINSLRQCHAIGIFHFFFPIRHWKACFNFHPPMVPLISVSLAVYGSQCCNHWNNAFERRKELSKGLRKDSKYPRWLRSRDNEHITKGMPIVLVYRGIPETFVLEKKLPFW